MKQRIKNLETRMDKVEKVLKLKPLKKGTDVKCTFCGYIMNVRSKLAMVSCSSCGNKTKNTSLED